MADPRHKIFRQIVLHNKLLPESRLDKLLEKHPNPEHIVRAMATEGLIKAKTATQLLDLYRKQVAKYKEQHGEDSFKAAVGEASKAAEKKEPAAQPAAAEKPGSVDPFEEAVAAAMSGDVDSLESQREADGVSAALDEESPAPREEASPPPPAGSQAKPKESSRPAAPTSTEPVKITSTGGKSLVEEILAEARRRDASDVHINAGQPPSIRIHGRLEPLDAPPIEAEVCQNALLSLVDEEQEKHFLEHQDLDFCYDGGEELGRFRSNFLMSQSGMGGTFRLISSRVPSFEELKLPEVVQKFTEYRVGIVLVTGPKSSGKTTTLAAMVDLINSTRTEHVITVEDPIEFVHPCKKSHVSQRELGAHTKSFANALRAALREAPDVIMVGEMRDLETTSLAITAAETGHLVLATLHTPDAIRTIGRVLDVFPPKEQGQIRSMVSESLRGIVSQQLVPRPDGQGMELALEILVNNSAIGNLIREDRTFQLRGIMQTGRKQGMTLLDDSLINLARDGRIVKEEAVVRATDQNYVRRELGMEVDETEAAGKKG